MRVGWRNRPLACTRTACLQSGVRQSCAPKFPVAVMSSQHGHTYFEITAKQTTKLAATNSTTLRALPMFLPTVDDQRRILATIGDETSAITRIIEKADGGITFLREYRTRLIGPARGGGAIA